MPPLQPSWLDPNVVADVLSGCAAVRTRAPDDPRGRV